MDYIEQFKILRLHECQSPYPRNDIGIARLFYDLHSTFIRYVIESKTWYVYTGKIWKKDEGGFCVMEMCKAFTQAFSKYAEMMEDIAEDSKVFMKFAGGLTGRKRREGILSDARSIQPIQPQTLARRSNDGSSPSPDIARLKGARLVNTPEPEKGLELNTALIKQLTGGDTYTGRFLHENPIEYKPEFKIFINTNYLPKASDQTIFSSGRVKLIPFERHFKPEEQDTKLKWQFRRSINKSGILNWLINGYKLIQEEGLKMPERITAAIEQYQQDGDIFGTFFNEVLVPAEDNRLKTSILHKRYTAWAKLNGYKPVSSQEFVGELRHRFWVKSDYIKGNVVMNYDMKK